MFLSLALPTFFAGLLTFLAPCTLPLVPAYLSFISGVSVDKVKEHTLSAKDRRHLLVNALLYVLGFTVVFVLFGTLAGIGGVAFAKYRPLLTRLGGVLILFFGIYLTFGKKFKFLQFLGKEKRFQLKVLRPGHPVSSLLFGAVFALGWTPCIGPILGSVLLLASQSSTVLQGALLLVLFSLGLGIPFVLVAALFGSALKFFEKLQKYLHAISIVGGVVLMIMGVLIVIGKFSVWVSVFYTFFQGSGLYDRLLDFL